MKCHAPMLAPHTEKSEMFLWSNSRTPLHSEQGGANLTLTVLGPFMTIHLVSAGSGASSDLAQDNESVRADPL